MKLNILFLPSDKGGVFHYRVEMIAKWLTKLDLARTRILFMDKFGKGDLIWADIIVCQRKYDLAEFKGVFEQSKEGVKQMESAGVKFPKLFIYDTDDYLHDVPKNNPCYTSYKPNSPIFKVMEEWIKKSDTLSVSTKKLAERYRYLNKNLIINPNSVDTENWEFRYKFNRPNKYKDQIRIGFAGSNTHYDDLKLIVRDLKYVQEHYLNTTLVIFGIQAGPVVSNTDLRLLFKDIPRVEFEEMVEVRNYPIKLKSLHLDIGIAPLVDHQFNQSKSAIKFYEYSMCGVPTIASKVGEYCEVIDKTRGILAKKNDWFKSLKLLIENAEYRKVMGKTAQNYVLRERSASVIVPKWYENYLSEWGKLCQ